MLYLLALSRSHPQSLSQPGRVHEWARRLYVRYRDIRGQLLGRLRSQHPQRFPGLDRLCPDHLRRVLFLAFAEDRGLCPPRTLADALTPADPEHNRPLWQNLLAVFAEFHRGSALGIPLDEGGLFRDPCAG